MKDSKRKYSDECKQFAFHGHSHLLNPLECIHLTGIDLNYPLLKIYIFKVLCVTPEINYLRFLLIDVFFLFRFSKNSEGVEMMTKITDFIVNRKCYSMVKEIQ